VGSVIEPPLSIRNPVVTRRGVTRPIAAGIVAGSFAAGGLLGIVTGNGSDPSEAAPEVPPSIEDDPGPDTEPEQAPDPVDYSGLWLPEVLIPNPSNGEVTVRALVDDAVSAEVAGAPVEIVDGAISATVTAAGTAINVAITMADGTREVRDLPISSTAPATTYPYTSAVHISARGWADPALREQVLSMVRSGAINAVQLDIKDESGEVGYLSNVELAKVSGATRSHYDPAAALAELHGLGVRVIARVVCFLDPVVGGWAWQNGQPDMVVQNADGLTPLANNYGSAAFTNLANPEVQQYLIDLSVEAAELGFDDILYDYIRRPEGKLDSMRFPGLEGSPIVEVARFVRESAVALAPHDVDFGVSVFGIAATRPNQIAQDIRLMAPYVDYVAPMVYPSHWGPGEYGVANPNSQPGDIVERSLADFHRVTAGTDTAVVPWLQAFSSRGVTYGPAEIKAQVDAADRVGSSGFLLWNSGSKYDTNAVNQLR
jgi:hypothetical protein